MSDSALSRQEYLAAAFTEGNHAYDILAVRDAYLHREAAGRTNPAANQGPDREEIAREMATIADSFYGLDQEQQFARLNALHCESLPDLERLKKRLLRVAKQTPAIQAAEQDPALDRGLWKIYKAILIAPQKEATAQKRKTLQTLSKAAVQKRTAKFVKALKRAYPELHQLESEWFGQLAKGKKIAKDSRRPANIGLGCFGAYFLFQLVFRLVRMLLDYE